MVARVLAAVPTPVVLVVLAALLGAAVTLCVLDDAILVRAAPSVVGNTDNSTALGAMCVSGFRAWTTQQQPQARVSSNRSMGVYRT